MNNTAMDSDTDLIEIGGQLKAAREAQGVSLEDVSARLKIREDHLQALENNDFDRLPGHVYAIGFIRTYAAHLGLNAADLISRFKEATMVLPVDEASYNDTMGEPLSLGLKVGLGGFAVFLVYLMWLIAGGAGTSERDVARAPVAAPLVEAPAVVETPPQRPAAPVSAPKASTAAPAAPSPAQTDSADGTENIVSGEPVQPGGEPQAIAVAELAAPVETAVAAPEPVAPRKVEIRASRRTWMRIENTEGKVLFSSIIRNGESFELEEQAPYTLATRDAGALHYHVDDAKVGNVGRRGQILTARQIDRAAIIALQN